MSCFVVSDYHVSALVAWAVRHGAIVGISPDALAHMLACANRAAYAERYDGDPVEPFEGFDRSVDPSHLAPVAIVKACDCLDYQASDWSAWYGSEPSAHLAVIRAKAWHLAMGAGGRYLGPDAPAHDMPGYAAVAWHLAEPEPEPADPVAARLAAILANMSEHEVAALRSALAARGAA